MSFGKMTTPIQLVRLQTVLDADGFSSEAQNVVASVHAYRESRHGSERWANRAAFSEATELFRFRRIPHITVTIEDALVCEGIRFDITSVEDVKGRGMYVEVLAKRTEAGHG